MSIQLLWTSQCLFLVLLIGAFLGVKGLKKAPFKRSLHALFQNPLASSSSLILLFFLVIGLLDCIQVGQFNHTLLDEMLSPIHLPLEKTFSAPLALTLFSTDGGKFSEESGTLIYPSEWFHDEHQKNIWILNVLVKSLGWSVFSTLMLVFCWMSMGRTFTKSAWSGFITLFVLLVIAISSYWLSRRLHILGTGKIGEDIFYYAVKSIRTALVLGLLTTLLMMPLALILGISAGYFGGWIDDAIQYIYTTLSSIPGVLLITASVLSMQTYIANHPQYFKTLEKSADARLFALCVILGVTSWTSLCRLLRAEVLKLREIDFVLAAKVLGSNSYRIIMKHLLPNVMPIVLITLVLDFSFLVLAEAVLSYVGVGVSPMTLSWGNMINAARLELAREPMVWWPVLSAFLFMFTLVLASNLFADAVRDAFDPHQQKA